MSIYNLSLTKKQAEVLVRATDVYMRLLMGQFNIVAEQFLFREGVTSERMDMARRHLDAAKVCLFPELQGSSTASLSMTSPKNEEASRVAYDIHQVIRHRLTWDEEAASKKPRTGFKGVWHDVPMKTSGEMLPHITAETPCYCGEKGCRG